MENSTVKDYLRKSKLRPKLMGKAKEIDHTKCEWASKVTGTVIYCCDGYKAIVALENTLNTFLVLEMYLLWDLAPFKRNETIYTETCT